MSSELVRKLRTRVDILIAPHVEIYGDDTPAVRMALRVLAEAEEIERELSARRVTTQEASERTGWNPETLQRWARAKLSGADVPNAWAALDVMTDGNGYLFVLGTIPKHPRGN